MARKEKLFLKSYGAGWKWGGGGGISCILHRPPSGRFQTPETRHGGKPTTAVGQAWFGMDGLSSTPSLRLAGDEGELLKAATKEPLHAQHESGRMPAQTKDQARFHGITNANNRLQNTNVGTCTSALLEHVTILLSRWEYAIPVIGTPAPCTSFNFRSCVCCRFDSEGTAASDVGWVPGQYGNFPYLVTQIPRSGPSADG